MGNHTAQRLVDLVILVLSGVYYASAHPIQALYSPLVCFLRLPGTGARKLFWIDSQDEEKFNIIGMMH